MNQSEKEEMKKLAYSLYNYWFSYYAADRAMNKYSVKQSGDEIKTLERLIQLIEKAE